MPKYYKKPKGAEAHQHTTVEALAGVDWIAPLLAAGQLRIEGPDCYLIVPGVELPFPILPTDWITLEDHGAVGTWTDAEFHAAYDTNL